MSRTNNEMAYIAEVTHVFDIPDADNIVKLVINAGWPVVAKRGEFKVGDLVVYFEIDSWVPTELAPFLTKGTEPREYNGVKGERLRTVRLRKQLSQGLVLPLVRKMGGWVLPDPHALIVNKGDLVGDLLGVQKWEAPETFENGKPKGNFPSFCPKTDAERIQNCARDLQHWIEQGYSFEVTEKLHGTSFTAIYVDGEFMVCSRNLALKEGEGTYWAVAEKNMLLEKMIALGANVAVQGEIVGPGILKNQYGLTEPELYVFNVFDIDKKSYMGPAERAEIVEQFGLKMVPVVWETYVMGKCAIGEDLTVNVLLELAEGKSKINGSEREGLVFKCIEDPSVQFKAVSNRWLEKTKE